MELTTDRQQQQMINAAQTQARYNTNQSQAFAREQMDFQRQSNAQAMAFSADQAQKNRDFQAEMSNTAHQREVKDLLAAGLNPILSSKYGGSSTPSGSSASGQSSSGASGQVDNSVTNLFNGLLQAIIGQATALQTTSMNNSTALQATQMSNLTQLEASKIGAGATIGSANIQASNNRYIQAMQQAFEAEMKQKYPQTMTGGLSSIWQSMVNAIDGGGSSGKDAKISNEVLKDMKYWFSDASKGEDRKYKYGIFAPFFKQ